MFKKIILFIIMFTGFCIAQDRGFYMWPEETNMIIADTDTISAYLDLEGYKIFTLYFPASFDTTEAVLYHSNDTTASTFRPVYDPDLNVIKKIIVTANREYVLAPNEYFYLKRYVKAWTPKAASGADTLEAGKGKYFNQ